MLLNVLLIAGRFFHHKRPILCIIYKQLLTKLLNKMLEQILNNPIMTYSIWGNSILDYAISLAVFLILLVVLKYTQKLTLKYLKKLSKKTKTDIDDTLVKIVKTIKPPFYSFLTLYIAVKILTTSNLIDNIFNNVLLIWVVYQITIASQIFITYLLKKNFEDEEDKGVQNTVGIINTFIKIIVWSVGILLVLSNLGINITSLVAGLGIGGIAIAFALQKILGDLFSSFAIYLDKPFKAGDFIVIGDQSGTVEKIGIKTTRIRTLQGEELVIPNQELTSSHIRNFKKLEKRRVVFSFGVTYETPTSKLREIPDMIEKIISPIEHAELDRAHFRTFDDSALTYEIVYYVSSNEYITYVDIQQEINLQIKETFEQKGIDMAYPTQTVYLNNTK